ncbi:hypothetical protein [Gluconobacter cerinus]|uniref:hypothetical protein n=1 Tax=Gluconobacter cerinus TaxID=38307 RepID=UPI001C03A9B7|nr:hypothetical protein [Gluconobacter cerinus]
MQKFVFKVSNTAQSLEDNRSNFLCLRIASSNPTPQIQVEPTGSGGDNGGMDLIKYRLDQLDKRANKTDAKLDKLVKYGDYGEHDYDCQYQ